jgi:hypothetical protein
LLARPSVGPALGNTFPYPHDNQVDLLSIKISMSSSSDNPTPAAHAHNTCSCAARASSTTRGTPAPAVHDSPPPPGDATYFTIARCNITPHPGGAVVPPITAPSLPAFASPNHFGALAGDDAAFPPQGVISPTTPGHSPSLLTPPSPPDGPGIDDSPPLGAISK